MRFLVRIPHGSYVVEVQSKSAWRAIQLGFHLRRVPFHVKKCRKAMPATRTISESDLLLIGATDPENQRRMEEICGLLGVSP